MLRTERRKPSGKSAKSRISVQTPVVAIGNGRNDELMLKAAAVGIAILGPEGVAREAQQAADLLAPDPISGLELLFHANRLKATLRLDTRKKRAD